jgi:hypothetical protein
MDGCKYLKKISTEILLFAYAGIEADALFDIGNLAVWQFLADSGNGVDA